MRLLAIIEASSITGPAKNLLEFAATKEVEISIATFVRGAGSNLFIDTAREAGISIEAIPEQGLFDMSVLGKLSSLARRLRPDIIQTHAVKSHSLARMAGLPGTAPWIAFHHGYTWPALRARAYNQLDRWSLRSARKVVTVSLPFRDELMARGVARERIEIVHNSIRADWGASAREKAAELRASLGIASGKKVLLIVGRLSREKDHATLLRALAGLQSRIDWHLVIVGEGPERPKIETDIERLGLADRVTLTGQQPSAEPYYGLADLAVLSSLSEGSPNALLEAMAAGVPILATDVGGIPEIVAHGESALLVRPGDAEGMAASITSLLVENTALAQRLVERSRVLIRDRHAPQARAARLMEIYHSVASHST